MRRIEVQGQIGRLHRDIGDGLRDGEHGDGRGGGGDGQRIRREELTARLLCQVGIEENKINPTRRKIATAERQAPVRERIELGGFHWPLDILPRHKIAQRQGRRTDDSRVRSGRSVGRVAAPVIDFPGGS